MIKNKSLSGYNIESRLDGEKFAVHFRKLRLMSFGISILYINTKTNGYARYSNKRLFKSEVRWYHGFSRPLRNEKALFYLQSA